MQTAFVGCGGIADHYLSGYRDTEWVEVVTCIDSDHARAERAAAMLGDLSF
ncbi:MAG: hypothetical protein ACREEM_48905 [Blastocatellia bacterium]